MRNAQTHIVSSNSFNLVESDEKTKAKTSCCDCICDCCLPSVAATVCCFSPSIFRQSRSKIELWAVHNNCSCMQVCCYYCDLPYDCYALQSVFSFQYYTEREKIFRAQGYFVAFNQFCIWENSETEKLLTQPTSRGPYLGFTGLVPDRLVSLHGRSHSLLTMSGLVTDASTQAGKYCISDHDAFKKAIESLTKSRECFHRIDPDNEVMSKIIDTLAKKVQKSSNTEVV